MLTENLQILFKKNLEKLKEEISSYKKETNIWKVESNILNSAGNLCLHLVGNLNTYLGAEIGKTGYIRNRELEFSLKNISREELLAKIDDTIYMVQNALAMLSDGDLDKEYYLLVFNERTSTGYFMVHLLAHLSYHLGQINYHRRLLDQ